MWENHHIPKWEQRKDVGVVRSAHAGHRGKTLDRSSAKRSESCGRDTVDGGMVAAYKRESRRAGAALTSRPDCLGLVRVHEQRFLIASDGAFVDDNLLDIT